MSLEGEALVAEGGGGLCLYGPGKKTRGLACAGKTPPLEGTLDSQCKIQNPQGGGT